jgi:tRNA U34 2-thiouridine synthase MnmA/TrmU
MNRKAVFLLSGGPDSILAARLILDQGIEVAALHFTSPFCSCTHGANQRCGYPGDIEMIKDLGLEAVMAEDND